MPYQTGLPAALARFGLKVETVPGWQTRGASTLNPRGAVAHWTAGPKRSITRPSLNICVNGRAGLPGPLCNVYLDRAGIAVVVAAGTANHAGAGGWKGLTGNSQVFGTEAECGGDGDWTAAQRAAYPRVNAAYCWLGKFGADMICGHCEWAPTRKIDIRDWPMNLMRSQTAALLTTTTALAQEDDDLMAALDEPIKRSNGNGTTTLRAVIANSDAHIEETRRIMREEVARLVLDAKVPNEWRRGHGEPYENPDPEASTSLGAQVAWLDNQVVQTQNAIGRLNDRLDRIEELLRDVAANV
jgi:hypothetical protein